MKKIFLFAICNAISSYAYWCFQDAPILLDQYGNSLTHDQYIAKSPFEITEGFMTANQQQQYRDALKNYHKIEKILEIGFNAGHSAENFFCSCQNLKLLVSVDIGTHLYSHYALHYFRTNYQNRFQSIIGDSLFKIPEYANLNPDTKFDLIFIDGNHGYDYCFNDIRNCYLVAHEETRLWIDDYNITEVARATHDTAALGLIAIDCINQDPATGRQWIEAHYLFH